MKYKCHTCNRAEKVIYFNKVEGLWQCWYCMSGNERKRPTNKVESVRAESLGPRIRSVRVKNLSRKKHAVHSSKRTPTKKPTHSKARKVRLQNSRRRVRPKTIRLIRTAGVSGIRGSNVLQKRRKKSVPNRHRSVSPRNGRKRT